jgi:hypothetical protein
MGIIAASRLRASLDLILDSFSNAATALSFRKLRSAYSGSCIKVRRSSDDTELDIGFVNNVLDTSSLLTFVGSGDGFVSVWYDQSGEGNNALQSILISQPKIVDTGSVLLEGGKPTIDFSAENNYFIIWNNETAPTIFQDMSDAISVLSLETSYVISGPGYEWFNSETIIELRENSSATGTGVPFSIGYTDSKFGFGVTDNYTTNDEIKFSNTISLGRRLSISIVNGDDLDVNLNSVSSIDTSFTSSTGDRSVGSGDSSLTIGVRTRDGGQIDNDRYAGNMQEIIIYKANQTSNISGLENNINDYYSIY